MLKCQRGYLMFMLRKMSNKSVLLDDSNSIHRKKETISLKNHLHFFKKEEEGKKQKTGRICVEKGYLV